VTAPTLMVLLRTVHDAGKTDVLQHPAIDVRDLVASDPNAQRPDAW
jgi:hypothetical protein